MRRTVQSFKREGFLHDQSVTDDAQNYQMHFLSEVSQLWRALPWEVSVLVGQQAVVEGGEEALTPLRGVLCMCSSRPTRTSWPPAGRLSWGEQRGSRAAQPVHALCSECGGTTRLTCSPSVLEPAAGGPRSLWRLPPASFCSASGWKESRHFHLDGRCAALDADNRRAPPTPRDATHPAVLASDAHAKSAPLVLLAPAVSPPVCSESPAPHCGLPTPPAARHRAAGSAA